MDISCGVVLEESGAIAEALSPFSPAPRGVFTFDGKNRGALKEVVLLLDEANFLCRDFPEVIQEALQIGRGERIIDFHRLVAFVFT